MSNNQKIALQAAIIYVFLILLLMLVFSSCVPRKQGPIHKWVIKEKYMGGKYGDVKYIIIECLKDGKRINASYELHFDQTLIGDTINYQHDEPVAYPLRDN
jgi:hypothetical protein